MDGGRGMNMESENKNDSMVRIIRAMEAAGFVVTAIKPEAYQDGDRLTGATTVVIYPVKKS
jgi:acetolactate synthase regulatory subunit